MALWKTSTAGSARSTSTSSNHRQACLKAALRGGLSHIPASFRPDCAISFGTARHRFAPRASLCARLTAFSSKSKKRTPTPCNIARSGWKRLHSKSVSAFEFAPDECPRLFISETLHRKGYANTKPPTKSRHRSWSRSIMYSSNASKSMRRSEGWATRKEPPRRVAL